MRTLVKDAAAMQQLEGLPFSKVYAGMDWYDKTDWLEDAYKSRAKDAKREHRVPGDDDFLETLYKAVGVSGVNVLVLAVSTKGFPPADAGRTITDAIRETDAVLYDGSGHDSLKESIELIRTIAENYG